MVAGNKEARLVLRLVDGVSAPAKGIVASLGVVGRAAGGITSVTALHGRAVAAAGQQFRKASQQMAAFSGPVLLGAGAAVRQVYDMQKELNVAVAAGNLGIGERSALMQRATELNAKYAASSAEIVGGVNELLNQE